MKKIFYFNPDCEMAVANQSYSYTPPKYIVKLQNDMQFIVAWFMGSDDFVLLQQQPSEEYVNYLSRYIGFKPNVLFRFDSDRYRLEPWGYAPNLKKIGGGVDLYGKLDNYSRVRALDILKMVVEIYPHLSLDIYPTQCYNLEEVIDVVSRVRLAVLKAPFSSSGRGVSILQRSDLDSSLVQRICSIIDSQGSIMVEERLDKVQDLSFHFVGVDGKFSFDGLVYFKTDDKGQYLGSYLSSSPSGVDSDCLCYMDYLVESLSKTIVEILNRVYPSYSGVLGIDMILYRSNGELKLHPSLEVNCRYSMGRVTLKLRDIFENRDGFWEIKQMRGESALDFHNLMLDNIGADNYVALTEPKDDLSFFAFLLFDQ